MREQMPKCLFCGKEITQGKSHKPISERKFCDNVCYKEWRGCREFGMATCAYCGKEFQETRDRPNIYCSRRCSALANSEEQRIRKAKESAHFKMLQIIYDEKKRELEAIANRMNHEKYCAECGNFFIASTSSQIYCSEQCLNRSINRKKDKRIYRNGKPDLSISLPKLFARDGGQCQICGRYLSFKGNPNGKYYPSIDHIIPLSKGGKHEWNNVQLACRKCNTIKSNTIPAPDDF